MRLSEHFTLEEFTHSDTAARLGIDNSLPESLLPQARETAAMMERIRAKLSQIKGREVPIVVTSGYRSPRLNEAIGSRPTSDHRLMLAVDFKAPRFGTPFEVCEALEPHVLELGIGQLIHEFNVWVHVSTRVPERAVNRVVTINQRGVFPGILEA